MKLRPRKDRKTSSLEHSSPPPQLLPVDLMFEIFSRLSLKSIAICRCVSKHWASVLGHSHFRNLLLTRSQARPRLLFACIKDKKVFLLSSPTQPDETSSSDNHHISFSFDHPVQDISTSVNGLVCFRIKGYQFKKGRKFMVEESLICNPSTGQSFTLPRMNTYKRTGMVRFFGYDPVEKQHKVLGIIHDIRTIEAQVLTLGGGGATWRMTGCGIPSCSTFGNRHNICINGVFYYVGCDDQMIICFDVRSDKYSFAKFPEKMWFPELLDCNGKLALIESCCFGAGSEDIEMWVLQDPERHEWSQCCYTLPPMWEDVVARGETLEIVGGTGPNELVMSPTDESYPFHVYYCNFEKETVTRVVIQGMGAFGSGLRYYVGTYLNHVEDVKLMES